MQTTITETATRVLRDGGAAGALSGVMLAWRGRRETGSAWAPLNAVSHWLWGRPALRRNDADAAHTATGAGIHMASSMLWATAYELIRGRRRRPTLTNAVSDAVVVTALAAVVDLKLTPERFTPGFERRLSARSLWLVYGGFAAGLIAGGWLTQARRR